MKTQIFTAEWQMRILDLMSRMDSSNTHR